MWTDFTGLAIEARLASSDNFEQLRSHPAVENGSRKQLLMLSELLVSSGSFWNILIIVGM